MASNEKSSDNEILVNQLQIATIQLDGKNISIPIRKHVPVKTFSSNPSTQEVADFFIPVSKEARDYNQKLIRDMKMRLTTTDQALDTAGYFTATSTINYTRDTYNSHPRIKMSSFSVNNEGDLDGYLVGLGSPQAEVFQLGYYGPAGHPEVMDQRKSYSLNWAKSATVPSSWLPVCTDIDSHLRGVQYNILLIYSNGDGTVREENCNFFHSCG